ncbi:dUTP diphosphatase [Vittaforma corneae ATCC 50505]|uniref:Deoxyuridine 5'-triphosphate nucleotidohydrolase n=1 Tax=Vittaforma corneae (strain ATCC 50505) TaxID=993615 RepID=L2GL20_VITCO|nr:dUTP diphosphatase [Vittaforma corneae ATCC 50505]ELA41334.1 dUTP diphosphatase [Vittaforma corneae ATCC 50505]
MREPQVVFRPLEKDAVCPRRHSDGAAGYDLHSVCPGSVPPYTTVTLNLGFSLKMPPDMIGYVCGRSGFALKHGINIENSYVLDDSEVAINIVNHSPDIFVFEKGTRIAQLFFAKIDTCGFQPMQPQADCN